MPILLCDGTDLSLSQNQNVGGSSCSFVILRNCPKSKTFPNFCAKSLISLFLQSSSNIAHGFMLIWNISLLQQPGLGCRTYYVSLRRPARPPWPHWGCPPPAARWNKVPPLLACSNLTRSALYYHNLLLHRVVHQVGLHHPTAFCLSLSAQSGWWPWNLEIWPSSGTHKCVAAWEVVQKYVCSEKVPRGWPIKLQAAEKGKEKQISNGAIVSSHMGNSSWQQQKR